MSLVGFDRSKTLGKKVCEKKQILIAAHILHFTTCFSFPKNPTSKKKPNTRHRFGDFFCDFHREVLYENKTHFLDIYP